MSLPVSEEVILLQLMAYFLEKEQALLLEDVDGANYSNIIIGMGWEKGKDIPVAPEPVEEKPEEPEAEEGEEHEEDEEGSETDSIDGRRNAGSRHSSHKDDGEAVEEEEDNTKPGVDLIAVLLDANGETIGQVDAFDDIEGAEGAIKHNGDNYDAHRLGDDEQIVLQLDDIPQDVHSIAFVIHTSEANSFSDAHVAGGYVRILDPLRGANEAIRLEEEAAEEAEKKASEEEAKTQPQEEEFERKVKSSRSRMSDSSSIRAVEEERLEDEKRKAESIRNRIAKLQDRSEVARSVIKPAFGPTIEPRPHNFVFAMWLSRVPVSPTIKERTQAQWHIKAIGEELFGETLDDQKNEIGKFVKAEHEANKPASVETVVVSRVLCVVKPNAVTKGLVGQLVLDFERSGLLTLAKTQMTLTVDDLAVLKVPQEEYPSFSSGPSVLLVLLHAGETNALEESSGNKWTLFPSEDAIRHFFPHLLPQVSTAASRDYADKAVGLTLAEGLAELCKQRPEHPIKWLAEWLLEHNPYQPRVIEPE